MWRERRVRKGDCAIATFMFATGIENSIPTINNGKTRVDEMEVCGHYKHWREDFDAVAGDRHQFPALRAADPSDLPRPRQV